MVNVSESVTHVSANNFRHVRQVATAERMSSSEDDETINGGGVGSSRLLGPWILRRTRGAGFISSWRTLWVSD